MTPAWAITPLTVKDIRVEGIQRTEALSPSVLSAALYVYVWCSSVSDLFFTTRLDTNWVCSLLCI